MNNKTLRPEEVVQQQLDAYNARDIDAFMAYWAEDAQYYEHPDTLLASGKAARRQGGKAAIRERHIARFKEPSLYGERVKRMALGSMVIDQEVVTRNFPQGRGKMDVIAIYEVEQGKILKAWFKVGPCVLDEGTL